MKKSHKFNSSNEDSFIVTLTKGICAVSLALVALWLLWKLTTPAGLADVIFNRTYTANSHACIRLQVTNPQLELLM